MSNQITTQSDVRDEFWAQHPQYRRHGRKPQNSYPADVRCAFVDFVDHLARNGKISEQLAERVTL